MSACKPSVCGVTVFGSAVGITIDAVASSRSVPPSRPAIPTMDASTSLSEQHGVHKVCTDVAGHIAAANREDEEAVGSF